MQANASGNGRTNEEEDAPQARDTNRRAVEEEEVAKERSCWRPKQSWRRMREEEKAAGCTRSQKKESQKKSSERRKGC